jgi:hypothetical protein
MLVVATVPGGGLPHSLEHRVGIRSQQSSAGQPDGHSAGRADAPAFMARDGIGVDAELAVTKRPGEIP